MCVCVCVLGCIQDHGWADGKGPSPLEDPRIQDGLALEKGPLNTRSHTSIPMMCPPGTTRSWFPLARYTSQAFNRPLVRLHRENAGRLKDWTDVTYLKEEVADRLMDKFLDIKKELPNILELGASPLYQHVEKNNPGFIRSYTMTDLAQGMLARIEEGAQLPLRKVVLEEEEALCTQFQDSTFDAVVSNLYLHWVNDLPGTLRQIERILVPDGVFLAAVLGGDTLYELR